MITPDTKAHAIGMLKMGTSIEDVATEFEIPPSLVRDWYNNLDLQDLVEVRANMQAVSTVLSQPLDPNSIDKLKNSLERTAEELSRQIYTAAPQGDVFHSKSLQQLCDGVAKLYGILVLKGGQASVSDAPILSGTSLSAFGSKMRD